MKKAKIILENTKSMCRKCAQACARRENRLSLIVVALVMILATVAILITVAPSRDYYATANVNETVIYVQSGDTMSVLFSGQGIGVAETNAIAAMLRAEHNIRGLRAGSDRLVFIRNGDPESRVEKIILIPGAWRQVEITRNEYGNWQTEMIYIEREIRIVRKSGYIGRGDSFYLAGRRVGIPSGVLNNMFGLLAFEVDFERDMRPGQSFSVMYEQHFRDGVHVSNGAIWKMQFDARRGNVVMYRFVDSNGRVGHFDKNGYSAIRTLLRSPIPNARVTSSFGPRRHPVLGFSRQHRGVDFRAAHGTPIPAAGHGRVVRLGNQPRGAGLYVRLDHGNGWETLYAHMSRFAPGLRVGHQVRQGQIIGFVGSTGLSTGPHLHYEIIRNGVHVNPMTVVLPTVGNLSAADRPKFQKLRKQIDVAYEILSRHPYAVVPLI